MTPTSKLANGRNPHLERTVTLHNLPSWKHDNMYILTGYRRPQESWQGCIRSVYAYLHNETGNIHTHLWGALLFLYLLITVKPAQLTSGRTTWVDSAVFSFFFGSATFCFLSSATYHTSLAHQSQEVCSRCNAVDYVGITVLNLGSFCPLLYYGFFCEPDHLRLYGLFVLLLNAAGVFVVVNPEYAKPTHIVLRTTIFVGMSLIVVIPMFHWFVVHGLATTLTGMGLKWFLLDSSIYAGGALLYANRIPERFNPGAYDYLFHSHQILHVCVVMGAYLHYKFISIALDYSHTQSKCA